MKKLLFLLFLGIFPFDFIIYNAAENCVQGYNVDSMHYRRQVALKGKESDKTTRTPNIYPIEVFLENKVLSLDFLSKLSGVTVIVTNIETNNVIYQGSLAMYIGILPIDLSTEKVGNYRLEIVSKDYDLFGNFILK